MDALILADDLTGGNATAAACARQGDPVLTAFDLDLLRGRLPPVTVIDLETRTAGPADTERAIRHVRDRVDLGRARFVGLRIDTTLRGNWCAAIGALLRGRGAPDLVVVTPAYPEAGRRCEGGIVTVDGRPIAEVAAGLPGAPFTSSAIEMLAAHLPGGPAALGLAAVRSGPAVLADQLAGLARAGTRVVVVDATEPADTVAIAAAIRRLRLRVLPVDPGPVMAALVANPAPPPRPPPVNAPIVIYAGTQSRFFADELAGVAANRPVRLVEFDPRRLLAALEPTVNAIAREIDRALTEADLIAVRPARDVPPGPYSRVIGRAFNLLGRRIQMTAGRLPGGLILTGGSTALAIVRGLGGRGILVEAPVRPLVARGRIVGGPASGLAVVTKGGLVPGLADAIDSLIGADRV